MRRKRVVDGKLVHIPAPWRDSTGWRMRWNPARERLFWSKQWVVEGSRQIRSLRWAVTASDATAKRSGRNHGAKKESLRHVFSWPYRKRTHVGGMRNLRRSRELALRNSAKCTRNFGRSVAWAIRLQRAGPGDCLPKTQDSANAQADV